MSSPAAAGGPAETGQPPQPAEAGRPPQPPETGQPPPDGPAWRRLDARMLAMFPLRQAKALIPVLIAVLIGGRDGGGWQMVGALAAPAALIGVGVVRWLTVSYRVGVEQVELRSGFFNRQHRSVRRDRIRTVDLTASPVHRVFGLGVVEIGTGSQSGRDGRLSLDAVTVGEGERLRRRLLDRSPAEVPAVAGRPSTLTRQPPTARGPAGHPTAHPTANPTAHPTVHPTAHPAAEEVARLRPSWLRFAPLTGSGLAAVIAVIGTAFQLAGDVGVRLSELDAVHRAGDRLSAAPVWISVLVLAVVVLVVGALGSLVFYLEAWWGYRLTREPDGTLRLRRGLLTTRSLSIEQRRMRGAEVSQSLPLRLFGGARCAAVTTGLDAKASIGGALLPPAPQAEAHRVATAALRLPDAQQATAARLRRHPRAALRRRLTRALAPTVVVVTAAWWIPAPAPLWPAAVLLLPAGVLLAFDRYRNLGHTLTAEYLVIGQGSLLRRRVALQRRGIIGWRLRQSLFQRRAGLVTLDAVTAAGAGRYSVVDLPMGWAVQLVEEVNPGLLPLAGPDSAEVPSGHRAAP